MRLFTPAELENSLYEATLEQKNETEAELVEKFVANSAALVLKKPISYRYFGPYWWGLKKLIIERGIAGFDAFLDAEWLERAAMPSPGLTCIAAWAMQESIMEQMAMPNNSLMLEDEEGDIYECFTTDPMLEELVKTG